MGDIPTTVQPCGHRGLEAVPVPHSESSHLLRSKAQQLAEEMYSSRSTASCLVVLYPEAVRSDGSSPASPVPGYLRLVPIQAARTLASERTGGRRDGGDPCKGTASGDQEKEVDLQLRTERP
ncbi:hypothetical protein ACFQ51_45925 [Streptomyces kaempferi]